MFAELVQRYRDTVVKEARDSSKAVREQHLVWWNGRFTGRTLAEITPDLVAEARDALASDTFTRGKVQTNKDGIKIPPARYTRAGATVNRYLATLSHMFTMAVKEWRLVDRNPVRDISKKKEGRRRVRFLSDAERDVLLAECAKIGVAGIAPTCDAGDQHRRSPWRVDQPQVGQHRSSIPRGGSRSPDR